MSSPTEKEKQHFKMIYDLWTEEEREIYHESEVFSPDWVVNLRKELDDEL